MKTISSLAAALGLAFATALPAAAAVVHHNFQLTGPGQAVVGTGSYSFDPATGVANAFGETETALLSFSLTIDGNSYGLNALDGGAGLVLLGAGNQVLGLEAYRSAANPFSFLPGAPGSDAFVVVGSGAAARTLDFAGAAAAAPAPPSLWLVATLLPLMARLRSRRQAAQGSATRGQ